MAYQTLLYTTDGAIATITLNRPESLNTIVPPMPTSSGRRCSLPTGMTKSG